MPDDAPVTMTTLPRYSTLHLPAGASCLARARAGQQARSAQQNGHTREVRVEGPLGAWYTPPGRAMAAADPQLRIRNTQPERLRRDRRSVPARLPGDVALERSAARIASARFPGRAVRRGVRRGGARRRHVGLAHRPLGPLRHVRQLGRVHRQRHADQPRSPSTARRSTASRPSSIRPCRATASATSWSGPRRISPSGCACGGCAAAPACATTTITPGR